MLFVQPVMFISRRVADFDRKVIDRLHRRRSRGGDRAGGARRPDRSLRRRWAGEPVGRLDLFGRTLVAASANRQAAAVRDVHRRRHGGDFCVG